MSDAVAGGFVASVEQPKQTVSKKPILERLGLANFGKLNTTIEELKTTCDSVSGRCELIVRQSKERRKNSE